MDYVVSGAGKGCANAFKQHEGSVPQGLQKFFWSSGWTNPDGDGGIVAIKACKLFVGDTRAWSPFSSKS